MKKASNDSISVRELKSDSLRNSKNFEELDETPIYQHPPFEDRKYLTHDELERLMPWGPQADKISGLVGSHIDALKDVAELLDTVLAFRKVNPAAKYWIASNSPVKGLSVKHKSEKEGPLQGLLVTQEGRRGSTVEELDGEIYGLKLQELIENNSLEVLDNVPEENADPNCKVLKVFDLQKKTTFKMVFDINESKFSVYRYDGSAYQPIKFKGSKGKPLTADYDAFDFYPRLKDKNFAGFKDIDTSAIERQNPAFKDLAMLVVNDVLELPTVRTNRENLGRLTDWDAHIIKTCNEFIQAESGYEHNVVMHGKEKRNTQYPELCNEVFFIFPDGRTLMSTNWEQTQAVDYAIKQEGFISTDNRAYNKHAGSEILFHDQRKQNTGGSGEVPPGSGERIEWDSRAAAEKLYNAYPKQLETIFDPSYLINENNTLQFSSASHPSRPSQTSVTSLNSVDSTGSTASSKSIPAWLDQLVRRASVSSSIALNQNFVPSSLLASAAELATGSSAISDSLDGDKEGMTPKEVMERRNSDENKRRRSTFLVARSSSSPGLLNPINEVVETKNNSSLKDAKENKDKH